MNSERWEALRRGLLFITLLYLFMLSIKMMGGGLELLGEGLVKALFKGIENPFVGLFVGILSTSILQSSGATTSMAVALIGSASGDVGLAIPIIMGANIGTTVTNALVSMGHITRRGEFRRAFGGAIVHDFFNLLTVMVLFPLEYYLHPLQRMAERLSGGFADAGGVKVGNAINVITKPVVDFMKELLTERAGLHHKVGGGVLLVLSAAMLFVALVFMVKLARRAVVGRVETVFDFVFRHPARALLFGLLLTALVGSSSIATSLVVPLVGAGVLTVEQIYPYTLGANLGTTVRCFLAALATLPGVAGLTLAFSHLLFNVVGISIFYPLRFIPISLAKAFAAQASKRRTFALLWVAVSFYLIPLLLILLSRR